jgi:hypothetical protein
MKGLTFAELHSDTVAEHKKGPSRESPLNGVRFDTDMVTEEYPSNEVIYYASLYFIEGFDSVPLYIVYDNKRDVTDRIEGRTTLETLAMLYELYHRGIINQSALSKTKFTIGKLKKANKKYLRKSR